MMVVPGHSAEPIAVIVSTASAAVGIVATDVTGSETTGIVTQLGVFAVGIVIGWWMLRRSDQRDERARLLQEESTRQLLAAKDAQISALERRLEAAENRDPRSRTRRTDQ